MAINMSGSFSNWKHSILTHTRREYLLYVEIQLILVDFECWHMQIPLPMDRLVWRSNHIFDLIYIKIYLNARIVYNRFCGRGEKKIGVDEKVQKCYEF